jgi:hypothetical protein
MEEARMNDAISTTDGAMTDKPQKADEETLIDYGMEKVAEIRATAVNAFDIILSKAEARTWEKVVYAYVIGGKIMRIGSSKGRFGQRLRASIRHIGGRLQNPESKSPTPGWEANEWKELLDAAGIGYVYARPGTPLSTPVGDFPAYLDEESILIGRHQPPLNRSKHR